MQRYVLVAVFALSIGGLFWRQQSQQTRIEALSAEVAELRADATDSDPAPGAAYAPVARRYAGDAGADTPSPSAAARAPGAAGSGTAAAPAQTAGDWTRQPPEAMHDELLQILSSDDPTVRARVRELVEAAEEERRDERRQQRQERWETHTLERLATLAQQVSLSQQQQDALFAILTVARDRAGEAFRQGREAGDFDAAREQAAKVRKEAQGEAKQLLDAKQYTAFEQMMQEERNRGRGRRGRGPQGGPPP